MFGKKKKDKYQKLHSLQEKFPQYDIGIGSYGDLRVYDWGNATLKMGKYCSIAGGVKIFLGGAHHTEWVTTYPFNALWDAGKFVDGKTLTKGDVVIGNDVWIATDAVVMSGVTVADGAVIGARAVVTKDVGPYEVVVGNPAKAVKKRFDDDTISRLLEISWWDWQVQRIEKALPLLMQNNIADFISAVENGAI
jgi:acetyltransferase-like isoleucine patch superfamily enzyme